MADTVPAQGPAATGTSTGATTATAPATTGASGTTTSTQAPSTNNATTGNANTNTSTTTTDPNGGNRGLPYYEKLRRDLRDALQKKRLMDKSMVRSPFRLPSGYPRKLITLPSGPTRRPNLPLRAILPRRNHRRKHHQRLRQLHQGVRVEHGARCKRDSAGGGHGRRSASQGAGD